MDSASTCGLLQQIQHRHVRSMARLGGGPFSRMGPHQGEDPSRDKAMRSIFGELQVKS